VDGAPVEYVDPVGLEKRKQWTREMVREAVLSVCGLSNREIYSRFTPTPRKSLRWPRTERREAKDSDKMKFRNLDTPTIYGNTDIDWALTLAEMSDGTVSPSILYPVGKTFWSVVDEGGRHFKSHMRNMYSTEEKNAILMAKALIDGSANFTSMFPGIDCSCERR